MNRLRILKKRIARSKLNVGISKLSDGWYVGWGTNFNNSDCSGPHTRREAINVAARIAMPRKPMKVVISTIAADGTVETSVTAMVE